MPRRAQPIFLGDGSTLAGIHVKNFLLTVLTLGIYSFWAKADVRQYLYSQTDVAGDRFDYSGTGGELFLGFLKFLGLVLVGVGVAVAGLGVSESLAPVVGYALVGLLVFPLGVVGSRRYRLSRTSWRGIAFSFRGSVAGFLGVYIPGALLTVVTLGIYYPFFHANVRRFLVEGTHFGNRPFEFTGSGADLLPRHLLLYVALPLTLGLYGFWHVAHRQRYYWEHTSFGSAQFSSSLDGGELLSFSLANALLTIVTLGIAYPWIQARRIGFQCEQIEITGTEAFEAALQDARTAGAMGDAVSEMFELELAGADFFGL